MRPDRRERVGVRVDRGRAHVRARGRGDRERRCGPWAFGLDRGASRVHLAQAGVVDNFDTDPGAALAYAYDIVCNGNEIGGGSIRIHRRDVQERVFKVMGIGHDEAQEKFGFLLDAFSYGAPPHGGIAFGWDRIVALLAGRRIHPRGHRLPEVRRRRRPADRRARADHRAAAQGGGLEVVLDENGNPVGEKKKDFRRAEVAEAPTPAGTHGRPVGAASRGCVATSGGASMTQPPTCPAAKRLCPAGTRPRSDRLSK